MFFWSIAALIITIVAFLVPDSFEVIGRLKSQLWSGLVSKQKSKQEQHSNSTNNPPNKTTVHPPVRARRSRPFFFQRIPKQSIP